MSLPQICGSLTLRKKATFIMKKRGHTITVPMSRVKAPKWSEVIF